MTINRINFKSSLLTQMQLAKPVTSNQVVVKPKTDAKPNKILIAGGATGGLLLILGIIKRKSITNLYKKLFV